MKPLPVLLATFLMLSFEVCIAQSRPAAPADPQRTTDAKSARTNYPERFKKYVGRYQLEVGIIPISTLDVTFEDGALWIKPSLVKKRRMIRRSSSLFVDEVDGSKFKFTADADGNFVELTFDYEGSEYTAKRVVLPPPSLKGNTTFRLTGHTDATIVAVAGSFNDWDQSHLLCGKEGGEWICRIDLEPGTYTYKFIVDGNWVLDPENPNTIVDDAGNTNNVFIKK